MQGSGVGIFQATKQKDPEVGERCKEGQSQWSRVNKRVVVRESEQRGKAGARSGRGNGKKFGFNSTCDEKPLETFNQGLI